MKSPELSGTSWSELVIGAVLVCYLHSLLWWEG